MTRKEPAGAKHARCLSHVPHAYLPSGWLCVTTREPDRAADMVAFADYVTIVRATHRAAEVARLATPGDGGAALLACVGGTTDVYGSPRPLLCTDPKDCANGAHAAASIHMHGAPPPARVRKSRKAPAPVVSAPEPVADPEPLPGQRNDDGEPDAAGHAAAHDFGDACACSDCIGDDPEPADLADVKATVRAAGLVDNPRPPVRSRSRAAIRSRARRAVDRRIAAARAVVVPEPIAEPIAPAAPVLAAVPTVSDGRLSCPRCGQLFRKSGAGLAWHLANRPDCAPVAPVLAAVQ